MTESMDNCLLRVASLCVFRGETALLDDLSLSVSPGEVLQIAGSNGSGKTTLLRVLCGVSIADEGEVSWRGKPLLRQRSAFHAETLFIGHKAGIKDELTPMENLRHFAALETGSSDVEISAALDHLGIGHRAFLPCRSLSAGQKRRVALARLLLSNAVLWILDEPMTALDVAGRQVLQRLLQQHVEAQGAVILTTHQPLDQTQLPVRTLELESRAGS